MLAQLDAAKDPENALHTFYEPFTSLGSSQFGIQPNQTIEVGEPRTPIASAPQADWGTGSHSGSPNRRAGYARGTAAEMRARKVRELKAAQPFLFSPQYWHQSEVPSEQPCSGQCSRWRRGARHR